MPTDSSIFVRSWPARPTNGFPWRSSSSPGPSPMITSRVAAISGAEDDRRPALGELALRAAGAGLLHSPEGRRRRRPGARRRAAGRGSRGLLEAQVVGQGARGVRERRRGSLATQVAWRRARPARRSSWTRSRMSVRHLDLAPARQRDDAAPAVEQDHLVVGRVEADVGPAHVVRDDEVHALGDELGLGVLAEVVRLGGEPDEEARSPFRAPSSRRMSGVGVSSSGARPASRRSSRSRGGPAGSRPPPRP